jgi:hypothetical protein
MFGSNPNKSKFHSEGNLRANEGGECFLSFSPGSFVFLFVVQKYKD